MGRDQPSSLTVLLRRLERLPGIGPKSALRIAQYLISQPQSEIEGLIEALVRVRQSLRLCRQCFNFADGELCWICQNSERDPTTICVVETPADLQAIETAGNYKGHYHCLHGVIVPIEGVGPDDLKINSLLDRVKGGRVNEVILALSPTPEGEATAHYIARLVRQEGVRVTQLAMGLPAGASLTYADQLTIARALEGRREL
ncbi:MAG: recombination mediator RecR [Armatimonadetes bacterium]|nr:recombination mediator RecR [Armatimonadota bacterium]MDW8122131.1 recombination mediator RecR [Armatimonadota bacterium]